ncbi:hypothetical protein QUA27_17850 [Microcoleus sp. Pol14C6]|uniref:hypothetical protein n=1 Tax=unclassified Microcoleus TaxID=2642155 RepID=UPI002FD10134
MDKFFTPVYFLLNQEFIFFSNFTIQFEIRWVAAGFVDRLPAVGCDCALKQPLQPRIYQDDRDFAIAL